MINPNSQITKSILIIYTLDSFIPSALNKASIEKDISKIQSLGPFACILDRIICVSQMNRDDYDWKQFNVYKGVHLN
jgi:hypothetical protein